MGRRRSELVDILRGTRLFAGLTKQQLNAIAKACTERSFAAGDTLVRQLDYGQHMLVLVSGRARVERDGRAIASVQSGDVVGEMSLIDGMPCSATVTAATPIEAIVLYRTAFSRLMDSMPALTTRLLMVQTARIRELDKRAAALG